jgi:hypothetical protein
MTHYRGIELDDTRPEEHDGHMDGIDAMLDDLPQPHYHVVAFINGCLNDYDSGPIALEADADMALQGFVREAQELTDEPIRNTGYMRYQNGPYIVKVESCTEDCDPDDLY